MSAMLCWMQRSHRIAAFLLPSAKLRGTSTGWIGAMILLAPREGPMLSACH